MENDLNPYASPDALTNDDETAKPSVAVEFKPSRGAFLVAVPFLLLFIVVTFLAATASDSGDRIYQRQGYRLLLAAVAAIGAYGCATVFWCRVEIDDRMIIIKGFTSHQIPLAEIESWWHQPFPSSIFIHVKGKRKPLPLNNWSMTKRRRNEVAKILRERVGLPRSST